MKTSAPARILVVDDKPQQVALLETLMLAEGHDVICAYDGYTALQIARESPPDLMLLDVLMPGLNGFEVCRQLKADERTRLIPIVLVTGLVGLDNKLRGIEAGADAYITKPFNRLEVLTCVRSLLKVKRLNDRLDDIEQIITSMAIALEAKDPYTHGHSERVAAYAVRLVAAIGGDATAQAMVRQAALLHDIGKIAIPESILRKPGPLAPEEIQLMRSHPVVSARICEPLRSASALLPVIRHHHERYDGQGYPDGLAGETIPLFARALAIADSYDAMTSVRPYRGSLGRERALQILRESAGSQWCPVLAPTFAALDLSDLPAEPQTEPIVAEPFHEPRAQDS